MTVCLKEVCSPYTFQEVLRMEFLIACYITFIFNTEIYNDNLKGQHPGG